MFLRSLHVHFGEASRESFQVATTDGFFFDLDKAQCLATTSWEGKVLEALFRVGQSWVSLRPNYLVSWEPVIWERLTDAQAYAWMARKQPELLQSFPERNLSPENTPALHEDLPEKPAKGKNINARMLEAIQADSECLYLSLRDWGKRLSCSHSTIKGTETWDTICKPARERARLARSVGKNADH